jgi:hypothetical protein
MLALDLVKTHLKLDLAAADEDALLSGYLAAAEGTFLTVSKRRWPEVGEPALAKASDPTTVPPTLVLVRYVDPAALSPNEQAMAVQYILLTVGHWYENRQTVIVGVNVTEVPATAQMLMNILREPTL